MKTNSMSTDGSNEVQINFNQARTPHSLLLLNSVRRGNLQKWIGSSQVLVGDESVAFSLANTVVKTDIVDGGIFPLEPCSGQYFTLRRRGVNPKTGEE